MTSDTNLRLKEVCVLPITKTLFNLGNGLNLLGCSLDEVIKPSVSLTILEGIQLRKFLQRAKIHLPLSKKYKESYHVIPPIGRHLKYGQPIED